MVRVVAIWIGGLLLVACLGTAGVYAYKYESDRCKAMGGHLVTQTFYSTTHVPGGYVNGKYVPGSNVNSSTTTTNCIDKNGVVLLGM